MKAKWGKALLAGALAAVCVMGMSGCQLFAQDVSRVVDRVVQDTQKSLAIRWEDVDIAAMRELSRKEIPVKELLGADQYNNLEIRPCLTGEQKSGKPVLTLCELVTSPDDKFRVIWRANCALDPKTLVTEQREEGYHVALDGSGIAPAFITGPGWPRGVTAARAQYLEVQVPKSARDRLAISISTSCAYFRCQAYQTKASFGIVAYRSAVELSDLQTNNISTFNFYDNSKLAIKNMAGEVFISVRDSMLDLQQMTMQRSCKIQAVASDVKCSIKKGSSFYAACDNGIGAYDFYYPRGGPFVGIDGKYNQVVGDHPKGTLDLSIDMARVQVREVDD